MVPLALPQHLLHKTSAQPQYKPVSGEAFLLQQGGPSEGTNKVVPSTLKALTSADNLLEHQRSVHHSFQASISLCDWAF